MLVSLPLPLRSFAVALAVASFAVAAALPAGPAPLFPDLGRYHFPADTRDRLAQRYFDQGMLLAFGFNPEEAARSFDAALAIDPACASCWWALAWALGPTINADMAPAAGERVARVTREAGPTPQARRAAQRA